MTHFSYGIIKPGGVPGNDSFTKSLLHLNGLNGGTSFPDVNAGGSPHIWTPTNAITSTAASKFNGSSMLTATGGLKTPAHADFALGGNDWSFDIWHNPDGSTGVSYGLFGQAPGDGNTNNTSLYMLRNGTTGRLSLHTFGPGITHIFINGTTPIVGTAFHHIEVARIGNIMRMFVNGAQDAADVARTGAINNSTANFGVGNIGDFGQPSVGYFQEFRLSNGIARHAANFTPPNAPYI